VTIIQGNIKNSNSNWQGQKWQQSAGGGKSSKNSSWWQHGWPTSKVTIKTETLMN